MFLLFGLISLISFVLYFYFIGLRFLSLIPLLLLLFGFAYIAFKTPISFFKIEISRYSLHIAWLLILVSIFGILSFLKIDSISSLLWILVLNMILLIVSCLVHYNDGKKIFQFGYYSSLVSILLLGLFVLPRNQIISFLLILSSLQVGFIGFIKFILGLFVEINDDFLYTLFVSGLFLICFLIVSRIPFLSGALSLISIFLTLLYLGLRWFVQKKPINRGRVSVRRILAGEKVVSKAFFSNNFLSKMYDFVLNMPKLFRYILEVLNVLLISVLFISFVVNRSNMSGLNHFFYWVVISFFVGNVLLLKRMDYTSFFQNLFLFLVINFAVYVSLFSYFQSNIQSVVFWSVVWNILTSLFLFILPTNLQKLFNNKDYWYWLVASIISFLVNVFLLLKTNLAGELIFFLLLLYIGIESILVFYGIKHISKKFHLDDGEVY